MHVSNTLAFRLQGIFLWPPIPGKQTNTSYEGCVEIHYLQKNNGILITVVRWIPGRLCQVEPLPDINNIPNVRVFDLNLLPGHENTHTFCFDDVDDSQHGEKLRYDGATLLELSDIKNDSIHASIPLQRYREDLNKFSGVEIGEIINDEPFPDDESLISIFKLNIIPPVIAEYSNKLQFQDYSVAYKSEVTYNKKSFKNYVPLPYSSRLANTKKQFDTSWPNDGVSRPFGDFLFADVEIGMDHYKEYEYINDTEVIKNFLNQIAENLGIFIDSVSRGELSKELSTNNSVKVKDDNFSYTGLFNIDDNRKKSKSKSKGHQLDAVKGDPDTPNKAYYIQRITLSTRTKNSNAGDRRGSSLRIRNGSIQLRIPEPNSGWLDIGDTLFIQTAMYFNSKGIYPQNTTLKLDTYVALGWKWQQPRQTRNPIKLEDIPDFNNEGAGMQHIFSNLLFSLDNTLIGLKHLESAQPGSVLPQLDTNDDKQKKLILGKKFTASINLIEEKNNKEPLNLLHRRATFCPKELFVENNISSTVSTLLVTARWPALARSYDSVTPDTNLQFVTDYRVINAESTDKNSQSYQTDFLFSFKITEADTGVSSGPEISSVGGLAFKHSGKLLNDTDKDEPSSIQFGPRRHAPDNNHDMRLVANPAQLQLKIRFNISAVQPISTDTPRGLLDDLQLPIFMREAGATSNQSCLDMDATAQDQYILLLEESLSNVNDRLFRVALIDSRYSSGVTENGQGNSISKAQDSFILFSCMPFALQRVYSSPLSDRGGLDSSVVAEYESDTRTWRTKQVTQSYHYVLPPQSVGESMDKPRRLEIHDLPRNANGPWFRPIPDSDGDPEKLDSSGLRRRAVEFRLTPPANLWIDPTDIDRNYYLPEWEAAELFKQKSELGLGSALTAFEGEFVYGLPVGLKTADETGIARRSRVAEVGAMTGELVTAATDTSYAGYNNRWKQLRQAYLTRPQRLEFWSNDPESEVPFTPAHYSTGARFALRKTALHRHPTTDGFETLDEDVRFHPHGLSGGALWPIESSNIANMVASLPIASSGTIEKIALSPLGGDADQTVRFANNRVTIITETRGGYIYRQKVEVIGRIAVLWHRAKHVVIYERTVNPTAQFTPEGGLGSRTRRPVLRKVSEFVEILESERRYPDIDLAEKNTNSFLKGVRFNSRIISVDSAWSEDVKDGWEIPLWNRYASRIRPQVYPRADIAFILASEGKGAANESSQECMNPENLYFFTDTRTDASVTDDTNLWPARDAIDYSPLPPPRHNWGGEEKNDVRDATQGSDYIPPSVPPGYQRFTWRLAATSDRIKINDGRGNKPVYAQLDSITFSRGTGSDLFTKDAKYKSLVNVRQIIEKINKKNPPILEAVWHKGQPVKINGKDHGLVELSSTLATASNEMPKPESFCEIDQQLKDKIIKNITELKAKIDLFNPAQEVTTGLKQFHDRAQEAFDRYLFNTKTKKSNLPELDAYNLNSQCKQLTSNLAASLSAKKQAIQQELDSWTNDVFNILDRGDKEAEDFYDKYLSNDAAFTKLLKKELENFLDDALAGPKKELGAFRRGIEVARSTVNDARQNLKAGVTTYQQEMDAFKHSYNSGKPWSVARLKRFNNKLDVISNKAVERYNSALLDTRQRVATELDDISQRIGASTALALQTLKLHENRFTETINLDTSSAQLRKLHSSVEQLRGKFQSSFDKLNNLVEKAKESSSENVSKKIHAYFEEPLQLFEKSAKNVFDSNNKDKIIELADGIDKLKLDAISGIGDAANSIREFTGDANTTLGNTINNTNQALSELDNETRAELIDALKDLKLQTNTTLDPYIFALLKYGKIIDTAVEYANERSNFLLNTIEVNADEIHKEIDIIAEDLIGYVSDAESALSTSTIASTITKAIVDDTGFKAFIKQAGSIIFSSRHDFSAGKQFTENVSIELTTRLDKLDSYLGVINKDLNDACSLLTSSALDFRAKLEKGVKNYFEDQFKIYNISDDELSKKLNLALSKEKEFEKFYKEFSSFDREIRNIGNDINRSREMAEAYGERAIDAIANVGKGGIASAPNNILRAMAAVGSPPKLPNLDYARDRLGYYYGKLNEAVDITPVEAWFGQLSEDIKALGISLPIDSIGTNLVPMDLSSFDIGRVINNCGGAELKSFFKGLKMPADSGKHVKITHDFDKKAFRAWVQIDVNLPLNGRSSLFSAGPFTLDTINTRLTGRLRLEASKDTDKVEQKGHSFLKTSLDAVVAGQSMVTMNDVTISYGQSSGLKVDFDASKIKLNPTFKFIQDTLQSIFGDEIGGMKIIKQNGIPVGLKHDFNMPPMSLSFGTSGVQNIQICNQFELVAYPDFVIADRFSLAKPDRPFIFTIFIIGGTGYITVDVEHRPFSENNDGLLVIVEAGAGGAASIAFGFAGCSGSIAITFSIALTYRKMIGRPGGGLTVSMVLLIAGGIDVLGFANAYLVVMLRLSYHENGAIDGLGSFRVTVRISRFFKVSAGGSVNYRMRNGKSQTTSTSYTKTEITYERLKKAKRLLESQGG